MGYFIRRKGIERVPMTISMPVEMRKRLQKLEMPIWEYIQFLEDALEDFRAVIQVMQEKIKKKEPYYPNSEWWDKRIKKYLLK
jgi:predicted PP-loop superfamily ATPase